MCDNEAPIRFDAAYGVKRRREEWAFRKFIDSVRQVANDMISCPRLTMLHGNPLPNRVEISHSLGRVHNLNGHQNFSPRSENERQLL